MGCGSQNNIVYSPLPVTSTTRPTGKDRFTGQRIYELDTSRELLFDGTGWIIMFEPPVTVATAMFTGITGGTPAYSTTYQRSGGRIDILSSVTCTTIPSAIATLTFTPPMALSITLGELNVQFLDSSVGVWYKGTNNGTLLYSEAVSGTYVSVGGLSLTQPVGFGANDVYIVSGARLRMASLYS